MRRSIMTVTSFLTLMARGREARSHELFGVNFRSLVFGTLLLVTAACQAAIVSVSQDAQQLEVSAGDSLAVGALTSSNTILAINELQSLVLPTDLRLDGPLKDYVGTDNLYDDQFSDLVLSAGTTISSHVLHFNPPEDTTAGVAPVATIEFADPILGFIFSNNVFDNSVSAVGKLLVASDAVVGIPGVTYETNSVRRAIRGERGDWIQVLDSYTIRARLFVSPGKLDEVRVITSSSVIPEPASVAVWSLLVMIGLLWFRQRKA